MGERWFYVSCQPDPDVTDWRDLTCDNQRDAYVYGDAGDAVDSWAEDNEEYLNDMAGNDWVGSIVVYVVEHDGETLLGPVQGFSIPFECERLFSPAEVTRG